MGSATSPSGLPLVTLPIVPDVDCDGSRCTQDVVVRPEERQLAGSLVVLHVAPGREKSQNFDFEFRPAVRKPVR